MRLPVKWGLKMMWAQVFKPKTKNWSKARRAIEDYIQEEDARRHAAVMKTGAPKPGEKPHAQAAE